MLKLTASFSKKVRVPGSDHSSQQYHAAVEVELPDGLTPDQLQSRIHQTFGLVQAGVESELQNGKAAAAAPVAPQPPNANGSGNGNGAPGTQPKASGKQIQFLTNLALRQRLDLKTLNAVTLKAFGITDIQALTKKQASDFIDRFEAIVKSTGVAA